MYLVNKDYYIRQRLSKPTASVTSVWQSIPPKHLSVPLMGYRAKFGRSSRVTCDSSVKNVYPTEFSNLIDLPLLPNRSAVKIWCINFWIILRMGNRSVNEGLNYPFMLEFYF